MYVFVKYKVIICMFKIKKQCFIIFSNKDVRKIYLYLILIGNIVFGIVLKFNICGSGVFDKIVMLMG